MRKLVLLAVLSLAGMATNASRASAWWGWYYPQPAAVAFPMVYPPGWYSNVYYFPWYYPWYANYNYSHGSYSNWWMSQGWAFYPGQPIPPNFHIHQYGGAHIHAIEPHHHDHKGMDPNHHHPLPAPKKLDGKKEPGKVSITLPADAKLLFNGVASTGTGEVRTFRTIDLEAGRDYEYVLTAEVVRDGQVMVATERVIVRAGSVSPVTLGPSASASK